MNRSLKFRVWNKSTNNWLSTQPSLHCFSKYYLDLDGGGLVRFDGSMTDHEERYSRADQVDYYLQGTKIIKKSPYVIQQCINLKDKKKKYIYEGDIIKFYYRAGDFAISEMTEKEFEYEKSIQKEYVGVISQELLTPINFYIVVGNPKSTHMFFPLAYAMNSEIIGNIFENKELLDNE